MLVKTKDGLELNINKEAFNDMRVIDSLCDLQDGNVLAISKLCRYVMSDEDKNKIYNFLKDENGRVAVEKFAPIFEEIMLLLNEPEIKN